MAVRRRRCSDRRSERTRLAPWQETERIEFYKGATDGFKNTAKNGKRINEKHFALNRSTLRITDPGNVIGMMLTELSTFSTSRMTCSGRSRSSKLKSSPSRPEFQMSYRMVICSNSLRLSNFLAGSSGAAGMGFGQRGDDVSPASCRKRRSLFLKSSASSSSVSELDSSPDSSSSTSTSSSESCTEEEECHFQ
ncbi:hypothetical protein EYF80_019727 [Liparis tanakae]|uniref:Uncharacterized protein n=1 Tax=Liparis tanakae TaxID=230148 RepID=A0A4Z2HWV2_9TELE|nr:hypothetical protein EYF80_019727 [Liparis tanakae]